MAGPDRSTRGSGCNFGLLRIAQQGVGLPFSIFERFSSAATASSVVDLGEGHIAAPV